MELNGTITAGGALYGAFGTDSGNYNDLRNKPSINGVELVGNKTSEDLHIDPGGTTDYEDLENKPQINYTPLEGNLTLDDLDIQSKIDFPEDPLRFLDGAGQFRNPDYFSGDYDDLANRPEIAGITLTGDKSLTDLGIQEEINFPSDNTKYLDGEGNFTTPAYFSGDYDDLANRPEIAGITLTGNQSLTDLGIQAEIVFPEDNTLYLDGNGNFTQPNYFSGDYDDLTDKPQINSVTLEGNKTASDLKLISEMHTASGAEAAIETDDTLPLLSCVSDINPVQDLHGYSKPWAGGAGKNKYPDTQDINLGGTNPRTVTNDISVPIGAGTYVISWKTTGEATPNLQMRIDGVNTSINSGDSFTVTSSANQCYWFITTTDYDANKTAHIYDIQIESGTTPSGYEPYSNICPISGHTDVTVTVASTSGGSGEDTTVSLGRSVYGGTLDVTTGALTIDKVIADLGTQTYTYDTQYSRFYTYVIADMKVVSNRTMPLVCSCYETIDDGRAVSDVPNGSIYAVSEKRLYIHDNRTTSPSDLATALNGQTCVYELATPQTFNLTKEQIITLLGDNYIRSDTGDIEITYVTNVIDPLLKYLLENR